MASKRKAVKNTTKNLKINSDNDEDEALGKELELDNSSDDSDTDSSVYSELEDEEEEDSDGDNDDSDDSEASSDSDNDDNPFDKSSETVDKDEYNNDSSDEEELRNTIGNIPTNWYDEYKHIGYSVDGKKINKPKRGDELENFLSRMENPEHGVTVMDSMTGSFVMDIICF